MPDKDNKEKQPNVRDLTNTGKLSQRMSDFIVELMAQVSKDDDNRTNWLAKMNTAINQRLGVKRISDYPYPGAADIPLPETDKIIKKQIPPLVMSAWGPKELVEVKVKSGYEEKPEWVQKARKAQDAMNQLLRSRSMDWFNKLCLAADYAKQHGHCLFRVREEFKSRMSTRMIDLDTYPPEIVKQLKGLTKKGLEQFIADRFFLNLDDKDDKEAIDDAIDQFRQGDDIIEITFEDIESFPQIDVPLPTKVIVPSYTTDINDAQRLTFEYFLTRPKIEMLIEKGVFRKIDFINQKEIASGEDDDLVEQQKRVNEGIGTSISDKDLFRVRETLTWYREKDTDPWQRWIFTYLADWGDPESALLQDMAFSYTFSTDGWNWDKYDDEVKDTRYYNSRGIPERIRAYQEVMERSVNNMLIRDEMNNTPMWEVLNTSELLDSHIRFVPGSKLPVKALGTEIAPIGLNAVPDMSSQSIMQMIKAFTEEYTANDDYLFRNATNTGGGKTLGEVQLGMQKNIGPTQIEVIRWNETLSKVYQKMFDIMKERLGKSMFVNGTEVTNDDFDFPADVRSNGDLEVADQQMAMQKSAMRLQVLMNPALADIVNSEDRYNVIHDWLEKDGVKDPDKFITDPKQIAQEQIGQLQQQVQQLSAQAEQMTKDMAKGGQGAKSPSESISFKDLPPEGQVQMAAQAGIQLTPVQMQAHNDKMNAQNEPDLLTEAEQSMPKESNGQRPPVKQ